MNNLINQLPWDVKSTLNKVKNAVMNYTEMEAKVIEATSNDPWGASSTLLLEIARGSANYQYFNETMPMIYKRMSEPQMTNQLAKWRQTYKSLQLLEYLIKNGDQRCIDNVRDHLYDLKALAQGFKFVDEKGKDQGVNVRHRAKEIVELIHDSERLQMERQKAVANRSKYTGVAAEEVRSFASNDSSGFGSTNKKYGGFGSDAVAPYNDQAQAYNPPPRQKSVDKSAMPAPQMVSNNNNSATVSQVSAHGSNSKKTAPQVDLLDIGSSSNDEWGSFAGAQVQQQNPDEFADFVSAPVQAPVQQQLKQTISPTNYAAFSGAFSQPSQNDEFGDFTTSSSTGYQTQSFGNVTQQRQSISGVQQPQQQQWGNFASSASVTQQNVVTSPVLQQSRPAAPVKPADVWNTNLVSLDSLGKAPVPASTGPALNQLAASQQQQSQSVAPGWSALSPMAATPNYGRPSQPSDQKQSKHNFDDLLL